MIKSAPERIAEFRLKKTEDFTGLPLEQRLEYLDALTLEDRTAKDYEKTYNGLFDNIAACLFSIHVPPEFMASEKSAVNHFINGLQALHLDGAIKDTASRSPEQRKKDIHQFVDLFCDAYTIKKPEIVFKKTDSPYDSFCSADKDKRITLAEDLLYQDTKWHDYSIVFHEMIHIYQHNLYAKDPEKYKIFAPQYGRLKFGVWMAQKGSVKEKYQAADKIYELLPVEAHAYSMQTTFTDLFSERILNKNTYRLGKMDYRNLWFGRQR